MMLSTVSIMLTLFLQGKTEQIDITLEDVYDRFYQSEMVVKDFIRNPSESMISKVGEQTAAFYDHYSDVLYHQTLYNQLFKVEPILNEEEVNELEELYNRHEKMEEQFIELVWNDVYEATDFSILLNEAKEKGEYQSEDVHIQVPNKRNVQISVNGIFDIGDTLNIQKRYFIIETEKEDYYWERPDDDYSMQLSEQEAHLRVNKVNYHIQAEIDGLLE